MDVSFRPIVEDDFQTICELMTSEEELFLVYAQGRWPFTIPQLQRLVEMRIDPTVMLHRGEVVGFANYYNHRPGDVIFVGNVVLDRALRGRGLGKRFVCHMIDRAFAEYDVRSVFLHVFNHNTPALLLYAALGFQPCSMRAKRDYKGEQVLLLNLGLRRETWLSRMR